MSIAALGIAVFSDVQPVRAQTVAATDPASVQKSMQGKGYQAELTITPDGNPKIASAASGSKFAVFFTGCTNKRA